MLTWECVDYIHQDDADMGMLVYIHQDDADMGMSSLYSPRRC